MRWQASSRVVAIRDTPSVSVFPRPSVVRSRRYKAAFWSQSTTFSASTPMALSRRTSSAFVNFADEPQYGLEFYYDGQLRGLDGRWQGINHPSGARLMAELGGYHPAVDGAELTLTLDRNVQHEAETILRDAVVSSGAESGNLIVLDPRTGAVMAMANSPTYDPGRFWEVGLDTLRNGSTSAVYEPGSVIKPLTIAAALDARVIYPNSTYNDTGVVVVGEQEVRNSDLQGPRGDHDDRVAGLFAQRRGGRSGGLTGAGTVL